MGQGLKTKIGLLFITLLVCFFIISSGSAVLASDYGVGDYGQCPYSAASTSCDISISNNGFILPLAVSPTPAGSCTIQSDQVTVSTYDPDGYTLTLGNTASSSSLTNVLGGGQTIPATSGTSSAPAALANTWGYRVDGWGNFGSGPTTAETNQPINNSIIFAQTEPSGNTPDTIAQTSSLNTSVSTAVWYGLCMNLGIAVPGGTTYDSTVQYTATAN